MKTAILIVLLIAGTSAANAQYHSNNYGTKTYGTGSNPSSHTVSPYVTNQGTYVPSHQSTNPNNTQMDNFGSRGNLNPYTGAFGTRNPRY
jgi:hypothetical protein